jgi:hypothetical protein
MFADPLMLSNTLGASTFDFAVGTPMSLALVDETSGDGRTVRAGDSVGDLKLKLSKFSSSTKENKPYGTKRVNVRLSGTKSDENGVPVEGFVQVTFGVPNAIVSSGDVNVLKVILMTYLLGGNNPSGNTFSVSSGAAILTRLLNGEK